MTQAERSKQSFLKEIRRTQGLNQKQAQTAYRAMAGRLKAPPRKTDLTQRPNITRDAIKIATAKPQPKPVAPAKKSKGVTAKKATPPLKRAVASKKTKTKPAKPKAVKKAKPEPVPPTPLQEITIRDVREWDQVRPDLWAGAVWVIYHQGGRYENKYSVLHVEFVIEVKHPPSVTVSNQFLKEVLYDWTAYGKTPAGVRVSQIDWWHTNKQRGRRYSSARQTAKAGTEKYESARHDMVQRVIHGLL